MTTPAEVLLKVYGSASVNRIAGAAEGDETAGFDLLTDKFADKTGRKKAVAAMPPDSVGFLAFMDQIGRRLRGERLKKRWFLHGYDDFETRIRPLVDAGLVLVGNAQSREPVSLETALEQGILQQWLQITPGFESLAGEPPPAREVVQQVVDETTVELARRTLVVEFNILNALNYVERHGIRLNRDGSPHRSDLKSFAPLIVDRPASSGRADTAPDPLKVNGWDLLSWLLSMGEALGMIERRGDVLRACSRATDYFLKPVADRIPLLVRAMEHQKAWSELEAARWFEAGEPPVTGQGDGGFVDEGAHGASLAGPRGSVFAAIRRLNPADWFDVESTVETITNLELQYLRSALPVPQGDEQSSFVFVRAVITRSLPHVGAIELGRGSNGQQRARLTDIGRALLGMGDAPDEGTGRGGILVEPNFEVTAFLDMASLRLLFDLSRFTDLARTGERVVRYRLSGESAQWGYARGYTADGIIDILGEFSAQPIPPSVQFALQDWERLHRRVTVFVNGDIAAATGRSDPEVIQSGIEFAIEGADQVEAIDAIHTFVAAGYEEHLDRALDAASPEVIDYDGPIVPSLHWVDDERLRAPAGGTDIRTLSRLQKVVIPEDDDVYRVAPDKVRSAFGDDGYGRLIDILRDGLVGGLSAEREIALKRLLGRPADGRIEPMEVLVVSGDDDGDRVARIESVAGMIAERLGPRAFRVAEGASAELAERLRGLGISVEVSG